MAFSSAGTKRGHLPPWEACKAFAFSTCLNTITQHLGQRACDLLGQQTNEWIAQQLTLHGGGCVGLCATDPSVKLCRRAGKPLGKPWANPGQTPSMLGQTPPLMAKHGPKNAALRGKGRCV